MEEDCGNSPQQKWDEYCNEYFIKCGSIVCQRRSHWKLNLQESNSPIATCPFLRGTMLLVPFNNPITQRRTPIIPQSLISVWQSLVADYFNFTKTFIHAKVPPQLFLSRFLRFYHFTVLPLAFYHRSQLAFRSRSHSSSSGPRLMWLITVTSTSRHPSTTNLFGLTTICSKLWRSIAL